MAAADLLLEVVTPEGVALRERVSDFAAPSVQGEFGVLPGHRPLLAALKTGIVTYHQDGTEQRVAVSGGFVELKNDQAVLLTDRFIEKAKVDPVQARLDLKEADEALDKFTGDPNSVEYQELVDQELWAAVQLELYGDPPPATIRTTELGIAPQEKYVEQGPHLSEAIVDEQAAADQSKED